MIFSCAVSFESKKKKIPDLSLPPCNLFEKGHTKPLIFNVFVVRLSFLDQLLKQVQILKV